MRRSKGPTPASDQIASSSLMCLMSSPRTRTGSPADKLGVLHREHTQAPL